ncbi:MAG: HlyD family secretion protein, partial [Wenzhouxiangellaceae bacterium]
TGDGGRSMRSGWLWTAVVVLAVAGGSYGLYAYLKPEPLPGQVLYGNGQIEATDVRLIAEVEGRVVESALVEGRRVARDDVLVRLDETDFRLEMARVEAEIEALAQERERARRQEELWRHHLGTAERQLDRLRRLLARENVPEHEVERAEDAFREARARVAVFEAEIAAIEQRIVASRQERELRDNRLAKARIAAPLDATVITRAVEPGEFVRPGQRLATLADLSRVELRVFIPGRHIGRITLDGPVRVRVDAFPDRWFEGRIARVDDTAQFTPRDIHMPDERTRMVYGVTIALDNPEGILKPGMPADAWILWQADADWPERLFVPQ